jgi:hypothetical protein
MTNVIISIDKQAAGIYDAHVINPVSNGVAFIGEFPTRPSALVACLEFCKENRFNPTHIF